MKTTPNASVNENQPSFFRYLFGFILGAVIAAVTAGIAFHLLVPMPPETSPSRHDTEAAGVLLLLMVFFAGGFIGGRGFTADFVSDVFRPVLCSYAVIGFLCLLASWSFAETAVMIGLASVGIISSAVCSLLLMRWLPPKTGHEEG
jgi:hypothetical protein